MRLVTMSTDEIEPLMVLQTAEVLDQFENPINHTYNIFLAMAGCNQDTIRFTAVASAKAPTCFILEGTYVLRKYRKKQIEMIYRRRVQFPPRYEPEQLMLMITDGVVHVKVPLARTANAA
jgi:HSP20 family molecular chaperone IbpA